MLLPKTEEEAADAIRAASDAGRPLRLIGGGTRAAIGRAMQAEETLSTQGMSGITLYEPGEMVISAKTGTPLSEIQAALAENKQMLTFEPMDHRVLLGSDGEPTIGAIAAGNISGPRRIYAGAARDSLIGVRFVNGRGEVIKNGGRVMKNVTGLDLVKLQAGAWGTLGLLTEVTFKLLPLAPEQATAVLKGLDDETAIKALCKALGTPFEATGVAHLPALIGNEVARTVVRVEGFAEQVAYRTTELTKVLSEFGTVSILSGDEHTNLWRDIRDVRFLAEPRDKAIWKLSVPPKSGPNTVEVIKQAVDCTYFFDWSGGLIWLAVPEDQDAGEETIRNAVKASDGYATLIRGSNALRASINVFDPQPEPLATVSAGIKKSFDPAGVLNPGLMA